MRRATTRPVVPAGAVLVSPSPRVRRSTAAPVFDEAKVWTMPKDVDRETVLYGSGAAAVICGEVVDTGRFYHAGRDGLQPTCTNTMGGWGHGRQITALDCAMRFITGKGLMG
ncbi:MAG: hypothetical protein ABFD89_01535 [Bryobacteraceae bacterium]